MTDIDDHIAHAREVKDDLVARTTDGENDDLHPIVEGWKNGKLKYLVTCHDVDRDQALHAATILVSGLECDEVWVVLDAHMSTQRLNPKTGLPWGPHEMQNLCDNEGACDLGVITDTLFIIHKTATRTRFASLPYHVHKTDRSVGWIDDQLTVDDTESATVKVGGMVADILDEAFRMPKGRDVILKSGVLDPADVLHIGPIVRQAALKAISSVGVVMTPDPDGVDA